MRRRLGAVCVVVLLAWASEARAADDEDLVYAGLGMAVPTYFLGVTLHEGSHALMAMRYGAEITQFKVLPGFVNGAFYFGYTRWTGQLDRCERAWTLFAPKITDLVLLTGYSLMVGFDALPENDYGKLALTVLATGTWVDFSKDIVSPFGSNDLVKIHNLYGRTSEWQRLPYRLLHLGVSAAAAYFVVRGYQEVFEDDEPAVAPRVMVGLWAGSF